MSTSTTPKDAAPEAVELPEAPLRHGSMPRRAAPATLAAVAALGVVLMLAGLNEALCAILAAAGYTLVIYLWSRRVEGARKAFDRFVTAMVTSAFLLALLPLVSVVWTVLSNGLDRMDSEFFNNSMLGIVGAGGGVHHAIFGTLIITGLATLIAVPIGLMTAIYLIEYGRGRLARAITFFVDVMTGIPSIVAGLFAFALMATILGPGDARLGITGSIALCVLMIPVVVRSTEEMLKLVPNELREASYALAVPKWRTIVKVVLPTSIAGIATGVTLAIARVIGETAPLLITAGNPVGDNFNPFDGQMATLSVFAYRSYASPGLDREAYIDRAWSAALLLILIVMALNLLARVISRIFAPKTR